MPPNQKQKLLEDLNFERFRSLAQNKNLSKYEKIGFFNEIREHQEEEIFLDIVSKLPNLNSKGKKILDIGPGCSDLPLLMIGKCQKQNHRLYLIDSQEMLNQLPSRSFITKIPAKFPEGCNDFISSNDASFDVILIYSVIHYMVGEPGYLKLFDRIFSLLGSGGQCLIGDVPNVNKRNRFFSSPEGIRFHQKSQKTKKKPQVHWNKTTDGALDDSFLIQVLLRARLSGLNSYLLPQSTSLPMANRREDILIVKP